MYLHLFLSTCWSIPYLCSGHDHILHILAGHLNHNFPLSRFILVVVMSSLLTHSGFQQSRKFFDWRVHFPTCELIHSPIEKDLILYLFPKLNFILGLEPTFDHHARLDQVAIPSSGWWVYKVFPTVSLSLHASIYVWWIVIRQEKWCSHFKGGKYLLNVVGLTPALLAAPVGDNFRRPSINLFARLQRTRLFSLPLPHSETLALLRFLLLVDIFN